MYFITRNNHFFLFEKAITLKTYYCEHYLVERVKSKRIINLYNTKYLWARVTQM